MNFYERATKAADWNRFTRELLLKYPETNFSERAMFRYFENFLLKFCKIAAKLLSHISCKYNEWTKKYND